MLVHQMLSKKPWNMCFSNGIDRNSIKKVICVAFFIVKIYRFMPNYAISQNFIARPQLERHILTEEEFLGIFQNPSKWDFFRNKMNQTWYLASIIKIFSQNNYLNKFSHLNSNYRRIEINYICFFVIMYSQRDNSI